MWPLLIMAGMSMLSQGQQNTSAAKAELGQARAVDAANQKNMQRSLFQLGMLQVQKADQERTLAQRKADLGKQELSAAGASANNAAASGTVGASVDAVQSDVQAQFDMARANISEENERDLETYNMQLQDTILNGQNSQQSIRKIAVQSGWNMAASTALQVGSSYMGQRMNLGLGSGGGTST